jgi:hypothetical protein
LVVVGIGTGRCGSRSLYKLFSYQKDFKCRHEFFISKMGNSEASKYSMSFGPESYSKDNFIEKFNLLRKNSFNKTFFDIGPYYLNIIDDLLVMDDVKIVSLKRDKGVFEKRFLDYYNKIKGSSNYLCSKNYWSMVGLTPPEDITLKDSAELYDRFYNKLNHESILKLNTKDLNRSLVCDQLNNFFPDNNFIFEKFHVK